MTLPVPAAGRPAADGTLTLPAAWQPSPRPPMPVAAAAVPVLGAVALWLVTGSPFALLLAALGPLIAVASIFDARRAARRDRRRAEAAAAAARADVLAQIEERHREERRRLRRRHPDVAGFLGRPDAIWRPRGEPAETLVLGSGGVASSVRVTGGEGDPRAAGVRATAEVLPDAPLAVPARTGVAVVGGVAAEAVHRALAVQLCLAMPPGRLRLLPRDDDRFGWAAAFPHRAGEITVALVADGETAPPADVVLAHVATGGSPPPDCGAVIVVRDPLTATLDLEGVSVPLAVEAVAVAQAEAVGRHLAERAARTPGLDDAVDDAVPFAGLPAVPASGGGEGMPVVVGLAGTRPAVLDLVADGPHAVVAGVTGAGKSELLITWVLALAAAHRTDEVTFLLADFKGGSAFDALASLPHVTGVITDLDGSGARRAIESLRAELRRREAELARCRARDIRDPRVRMPRLVVVIDEFAALLGEHPELQAIFADVAARGRALGLHLILGTQRVAGVIRDGLLANCPLRVSLRVTDPADSRAVIGADDAASLPGDASGRGIALVRRPRDAAAQRVRIGLSTPADVARVAAARAGARPPAAWLPPLAPTITLDELRAVPGAEPGSLLLGLVDEPERQRQRAVAVRTSDRGLLVVGGPGSGRTTALQTIAGQAGERARRIPASAEAAWDAVAELAAHRPAPGEVVVVDDLDALVARYPQDYAIEIAASLERLFRAAGAGGYLVVASAQRLTGPVARIADTLPQRLHLAASSLAEHLAAGGAREVFDPDAAPGRGAWRGRPLQVAVGPPPAPEASPAGPRVWRPDGPLAGVVVRGSAARTAAASAWPEAAVMTLDAHVAEPAGGDGRPVVLFGDPDDWQRHWRLLTTVRGDHDLIVDALCASEYRVVTASRELPPYAESGRAWLRQAGGAPERIVLPGPASGSHRRRGMLDLPGDGP